MLTNLLGAGLFSQQLKDTDTGLFGGNHVGVGQGVVQVPGKHVTHAGLTSLKAPQPIHHAAVDTPEHTRNLTELRARDNVASRSTQNSG